MLRDKNHDKKSNKKKSKSIKDRNLTKNAFKTKRLSIYAKSYNNNNLNLFHGVNKNKNDSNLNLFIQKRNSRIEIDSNKALNIRNLKKNTLKLENTKLSPNNNINKEKKFNNFNIENKENIFNGNDNIYNNAKKTKSLDNKEEKKKNKDNKLNKVIISAKNKENNFKIDRKLNLKNIKTKKENNNNKLELIKNQKINNENLENKKIIISNAINSNDKNDKAINDNKQINEKKENKFNNNTKKEYINIDNKIENNNKENNNKNLENIIKEITITNNNIYENKKINEEISNNVEIKEEKNIIKIENNPQKEIPILKLDEEKSDKISSEKEEKEENSKEKIPFLKLNCSDSSSTSKNNKNSKSVSYSEYSESNYESDDGLEIKGELLIKNKKTAFLNNVKKCLFNKVISLKKELNDFNSNSITNTDEDLKFKNKINFQKKKTAEFSNNIYKINLKENISFTESEIIPKQIIKSSIITEAGLNDNKKKINQDSYLISENIFNQKLNIYGIFDGHGKNGHLISNLVSKFLSQYFTNKKNYYIPKKNESQISDSNSDSFSIKSEDININDETIEEIFKENNKFIENTINKVVEKSNECNFNIEFSGTTCTLLFILENKLICSNIGDSQCVLFNCSDEDRWTHEIISVIHKPDDPKEKERILEMGGVIHPYYDENGIYEGPNRVYAKGKTYPGLSLSRSIGDLAGEEIGIISEPDIIIKNIDSTCKYIVMGSDGLWDMIKPYDANRIVNPFFNRGDIEGGCKALLKRAIKYWEKEGSDRDDISILLIFIGKPNKSIL